MAKLVEIAAREIVGFPAGFQRLSQRSDGLIVAAAGYGYTREVAIFDIAEDRETAVVTRAQWEAERARIAMQGISEFAQEQENAERASIAANQQSTAEAREIARSGAMTSEEQELAEIACGKRSREDQALWDKVARDVVKAFLTAHITHYGHDNVWGREDLIGQAFDYADAFMAERAKRMKGGV